jgi:hypothetical protein
MKKIILTFVLAIMLTLSINTKTVFANDTALSAYGDNVGPFEGTPDIVLDHEIINLDIYPDKTLVDVTFYLKNEGSRQTILVGFPDEYASYGLAGQEEFQYTDIVGPIMDFQSTVDGVPVHIETKTQVNKKIVGDYPENFKVLWHVWPTTFEPAKTTVINNKYWVKNGINVMGERNFGYTLMTGAKWKDKINSAKIYANLKGGLIFSDIKKEYSTSGITYINNNKAMWEFKDFEPSKENGKGYFSLSFKRNLGDELGNRLLTESDLTGLDFWQLKVLRNEVYARHGRPFKTESLQNYFNSTTWYKVNRNYSDHLLNEFERKNAAFILNYEKKVGSDIIYSD